MKSTNVRIISGFEEAKKVLSRQARRDVQYPQEADVRRIIERVRLEGDKALFDLAKKFDGATLTALEVDRRQVAAAYKKVDGALVDALKLAAERITAFHGLQRERALRSYTHGKTGWLVRPLDRVGVYTPGSSASYPSSLLMSAIPARVAGVRELVLTTPAANNGSIAPATLVAADIAGIDRVFAIGGAQAIAALAYGTETVPRVDKICGPGNIYVFLAKKLLYGVVGIDGLWGPSEVVVIADPQADPEECAADMLAQAEHDALATAVLITTTRTLAEATLAAIERQLKTLPRATTARKSLEERGAVAIVANLDEAVRLTNLFAPEHVCLLLARNEIAPESFTNAGCIIYGGHATEPMSDYVSGPSHVLPTEGTARFSSPLNVTDFLKITNLSSVGNALMALAGQAAITIARAEGLEAHARAVELRMKRVKKRV